jgi:hypothetical protein
LRTKNLLYFAFALSLCMGSVRAEDIYIAQASAGSDTGADPADAHSAAWFNTLGNWGSGAGKVSPGDTVHLVGTITTQLTVQASGTSGNITTILFESGAKLSRPAGTLMTCQKNFITIDGGTNGIIENTANGTGLGNDLSVSGVYAPGVNNFEARNLTIRNLYVHTGTGSSSADLTTNGGILFSGFGSNISIHNNSFSDICWCLNSSTSSGAASNINIYDNTFTNYDHGIGGLGGVTAANIYDNHFGSTANWDTSASTYHHDAIHIYFNAGTTSSNIAFYGNLFDGDWGINNTAHIFLEGDFTYANPLAQSNFTFYNNVFIQNAGNLLNNGFTVGGGASFSYYNNTFIGSGVTNSIGVSVRGTNLHFKNNIVSGVTTFVYNSTTATFATGGLNNNLYAAATSGGNSPWKLNNISYSTLAAWKTLTGQDANTTQVSDAQLLSDGQLNTSSPAIGAGADLSSIFTTDKDGTTRIVPWDIGAYKYQDSGSPPDSPTNLRIVP